MSDLFVRHAEICKTFSNPKRLEIIDSLRDGLELSAGQLLKSIDISKANLSQHMSILIKSGVVVSHRESQTVLYQLSDKRITEACDLMREVLISRIELETKVLEQLKK